ncbi:hypothetical protein AOC36_08690 [Erysipelothrix larvae]|uniref:Polysaccharide chain length determinant N-terminal domain-containing protein n=1 Tax=Erysipelothrix larvae TaxID=1514105 RepID=A0A0X8H0Y0_9FIRM|nr:Wzz/FepE/Etk N-terminal domain-containing protein [Erysipelothrix larvae]AMC94062.1 hypothetical protein AOC36_08690 [Erysipelothrix larvae]
MNQFSNDLVLDNEISVSEIYGVFKPFIVLIVLVGLGFSIGGFLWTRFLVDPVYESNATLIVNNRREENTGVITNDEIISARGLATVYSIIIKSDVVLNPVISNTNSNLETEDLAKNVSVSAVDNTQVFRISVRDTDPDKAYGYANEIVNVAPDIIVDMVEAGSVRIISSPLFPTTPVSPSIFMNSLIAFIIGVLCASGVVFVRHILDRTVRSPEDIEKHLGFPVIGIIPNTTKGR